MRRSPEIISSEQEPELKVNFREKLTDFLAEANPELLEKTQAEQEILREKIVVRERVVAETSVPEVLEKFGIKAEGLEKTKSGYWTLPITKKLDMASSLPAGYAFKGGAARALLLRNLGLDDFAKPRDLDVIRLAEAEPYPGSDDNVSREFMPEDFKHSYGVEIIEDLDEYYDSRDFSINEIIADNEQIQMTESCLLDTVRRIIRLTEYERDSYRGEAGPKMLAKALRLYAETVATSGLAPQFENINDWEFEEYFISPFWLALNMDKAFEQGLDIAHHFTKQLKTKKQIPGDIETAEEAAAFLFGLLSGDSFYYRYAPQDHFSKEDELMEEYKDMEKLPKNAGMHRPNPLKR